MESKTLKGCMKWAIWEILHVHIIQNVLYKGWRKNNNKSGSELEEISQ